MIFWILLVLAVLAVISAFAWGFTDDGIGFGFLGAFIASLFAGLAGFGLLIAASAIFPHDGVVQHTYPLRALGNTSTLKGEFFLGSGVINGSQQFNFIEQHHGWSELASGDASGSRVFEGNSKPSVTEYDHSYSNHWVFPWDMYDHSTYDFHVPKGSVDNTYQVTTGK